MQIQNAAQSHMVRLEAAEAASERTLNESRVLIPAAKAVGVKSTDPF